MRSAVVVLTALVVGSVTGGCNSKSSPASPASNQPPAPAAGQQQPNPVPAADATAGWTLKYQAKCDPEMSPEDECLGGYGFSVMTDGQYQIGPSATGKTKTGTLTPEELKSVTGALSPILTASQTATENHATVEPNEGVEDTLTLTQGTNSGVTLVHIASTDYSFRTTSLEQANGLMDIVKTLLQKYYVLPFPDTCADEVSALQTLFTSMQTCTTDSECAYFDSNFDVMTPDAGTFLTTDDCSRLNPLAVGNINSVKSNKDKLLNSMLQLQNTCGPRIVRNDCEDTSGFTLNGKAAVCKQGVCQLGQTSGSSLR